jgi:hypothetical protein
MLTPEYVVMGLGLVLVAWYFVATVYNRRLGLRTFRWLQAGLDTLGNRKQVQASWIGSSGSGARISLKSARPPFQRLELVYLLESRELAPLWLFELIRGKRDQLIFRGTLRQPQPGELEVLPAGDRLLQQLRRNASLGWSFTDAPHHLVLAQKDATTQQVEWITPFLERYGLNLRRFSWGPQDPHLLIILRLTGLLDNDAAILFQHIHGAAGGTQAH